METRFWRRWRLYCRAVEDEPRGAVCHFCGKPNNFYDDIGWFYFPVPGCRSCWNGPHGEKHRDMYGLGDR